MYNALLAVCSYAVVHNAVLRNSDNPYTWAPIDQPFKWILIELTFLRFRDTPKIYPDRKLMDKSENCFNVLNLVGSESKYVLTCKAVCSPYKIRMRWIQPPAYTCHYYSERYLVLSREPQTCATRRYDYELQSLQRPRTPHDTFPSFLTIGVASHGFLLPPLPVRPSLR